MKKIYPLAYLLILHYAVFAQAGEWTWMKGSSTANPAGNFGVQGVAAASNTPPGVYSPIYWTDSSGIFWLYGGAQWTGGANKVYEALWKFDPVSNLWTWVNGNTSTDQFPVYGTIGVPSPTNSPGARSFSGPAWVDLKGNLWFYAAASWTTFFYDLWKYDPVTNEWTCMQNNSSNPVHGTLGVGKPTNTPGIRWKSSAAWVDDAGDLWFFGGTSFSGEFADVWKFDIANNYWIWMAGDSVPAFNAFDAVYGTQGVFDPTNTPGTRNIFCHWKGLDGKFWIYGGGNPYTAIHGDYWVFDPAINQWAWMKGVTTTYYPGVSTAKCDTTTTNIRRGVTENSACWVDKAGNFWHLGGATAGGNYPCTNDLWVYNPNLNEEVWVSGNSGINPNAVYGTQGVSDPANVPDGRSGGTGWIDQNCNLWYFGGRTEFIQDYNDLWKYVPDSTCFGYQYCSVNPVSIVAFNVSDTSICEKYCVDFFDQSTGNPTAWQWSFPGGNPSASSLQNPSNICYSTSGTYNVTLIVTGSAGNDTLGESNFITVNAAPIASITQSNDTLYSSSGNSYQWYTGGNPINGATDDFYVPPTEDYYSVVITGVSGCTAADTVFFSLSPQTNFAASDTTICQKFCMDFFDQSGNNPVTWQWSFPGGVPSSSVQQDPTQICYNNPGVYDVTLITTNSYGSDTLVLQGYITVYSTPPLPTITDSGDVLTSSYASSYQWQFNSVDIPGATNQSYTATQTGFYTVIITDENGCVSSTTVYVEITGIENVTGDSGLSVYPNPSTGNFIIELPGQPTGKKLTIEVVTPLNQKIFSSTTTMDNPEENKINLTGIAAGVYFIIVTVEDTITMKKIIIF